jgi:hypothetical protein
MTAEDVVGDLDGIAVEVLRAERVARHEAMPGAHPEAPERPLPADAAVVAAAFN